jgi:hypothetical protein
MRKLYEQKDSSTELKAGNTGNQLWNCFSYLENMTSSLFENGTIQSTYLGISATRKQKNACCMYNATTTIHCPFYSNAELFLFSFLQIKYQTDNDKSSLTMPVAPQTQLGNTSQYSDSNTNTVVRRKTHFYNTVHDSMCELYIVRRDH